MSELSSVLRKHAAFDPVIRTSLPFKKLDFTSQNRDLLTRDLSDTSVFSDYVFNELLEDGTFAGAGGYGENRVIYRQRDHFAQDEINPRCIHLGTDIWVQAGEAVYAPLDAHVHSFAFNDQYGDYGLTIILSHELEGITFFTLYGHLSLSSLEGLFQGKNVTSGEKIGYVGKYPENGDWPPHLHFQIIAEMGTQNGDFPGVSSVTDAAYYLLICPEPNLILNIDAIRC